MTFRIKLSVILLLNIFFDITLCVITHIVICNQLRPKSNVKQIARKNGLPLMSKQYTGTEVDFESMFCSKLIFLKENTKIKLWLYCTQKEKSFQIYQKRVEFNRLREWLLLPSSRNRALRLQESCFTFKINSILCFGTK